MRTPFLALLLLPCLVACSGGGGDPTDPDEATEDSGTTASTDSTDPSETEETTDPTPSTDLTTDTGTPYTKYTTPPTGPYGPENRWWHADAADVPTDLAEDGTFGAGYRPPNLTFEDQFGDEVSLYQFHGRPVQLSITTMWVAPGQEMARDLASAAADLDADGFQVVELVFENLDGAPPTADDIEYYVDGLGITDHPVLRVADGSLDAWVTAEQGQLPITPILDTELRVVVESNIPFDEQVLRQQAGN